jgi:hypothetical protein
LSVIGKDEMREIRWEKMVLNGPGWLTGRKKNPPK